MTDQEEQYFTAAAFNRFLSAHKLMGSRCQDCGQLFLPPRALCSACHSSAMEWHPFAGQGELAAFTSVFIGPARLSAAGYSRENPYLTGIVRLAEGPMISARLVGMPARDPAAIQIGTPLQVTFIQEGAAEAEGPELPTVLAFEPAG
jgi:uncharacterized OB-fold protein